MMPNFLIIGANKAGTTSLYEYLKQHPDIFMSPGKEPMFFKFEGKEIDSSNPFQKAAITKLEDYQALFKEAKGEKAIGEASTAYLHNPWCAKRIKHYIPNVKLIAILRNPAEKAYSNYSMYVQLGFEKLTFDEAIAAEMDGKRDNYHQGWQYLNLGFYYEPIRHFYNLFDRDQIRVYIYEDFKTNPINFIRNIFQFLEVDDNFLPDISKKYKVSLVPKNRLLHSMLTKPNVVKSTLEQLMPAKLNKQLNNILMKRNLIKPPQLPADIRRKLTEFYRDDILSLSDLIERDLSKWLD